MNWKLVKAVVALGVVTLMAGCGAGGGGSIVDASKIYSITLRTDKAALPLNIAHFTASIGGPYTTTLYVEARDSTGHAIPGGEGVFGCSIVGSLDSGALYYLDGKTEHQTTTTLTDGTVVTTPNAYRSVTLGSNAGAASFHYHATDVAGTATIRCSVTDLGGTQRSAETTIQVGGTQSGKVSQIVFAPFSPNYLFIQGMNNYTQVQIQLNMVDEAGQQIVNPTPGTNNLEVNIWNDLTSTVEDNAVLRGVDATGKAVADKSIKVASINGQAQVTLVSGATPGTIILEAVSDRADNNVDNGITERVSNLVTVAVVTEIPGSGTTPTPPTPLAITTTDLPAATEDIPYGAVLEGSGGSAPYTWSLTTGSYLPFGLSLASTGVITGIPYGITSGTFTFVVKMTDALGASIQQGFSIAYTAAPVITGTPYVTTSTLSTCSVGNPCVRTVSASGGTPPYTFTAIGLPNGLALSTSGVLSGTPTAAGNYEFAVTATASGKTSAPQIVRLTVTPSNGALTVMTTALPNASTGGAYSTQILAAGGATPYTWSVNYLPAGLTLNTTTGVISGVPTVAGTFTIRVTVRENGGLTAYRDLELTIGSDGGSAQALTVTPAGISSVAIGQPVQMMVYGGVAPYTVTSTNLAIGTISAPGIVASSGGFFTFNPVSQGSVTLIVTDSLGTAKTVTMTTVQPGGTTLAVLPGTVNWTIGGTCLAGDVYTDFVVYGGAPSYTAFSTAPLIATVPSAPTLNGDGYYYFRVSAACNASGNATIVIRDSVNAQVSGTFTVTLAP